MGLLKSARLVTVLLLACQRGSSQAAASALARTRPGVQHQGVPLPLGFSHKNCAACGRRKESFPVARTIFCCAMSLAYGITQSKIISQTDAVTTAQMRHSPVSAGCVSRSELGLLGLWLSCYTGLILALDNAAWLR